MSGEIKAMRCGGCKAEGRGKIPNAGSKGYPVYGGNGVCSFCSGVGTHHGEKCHRCGGTGICPGCKGTGVIKLDA